ncbi:hypothetical protein [Mesorhizobium sp.]|uniref:hypothetical protein n=1 Tax=Mesorhizobium sp. TaxID=1871066 RepID=UPI002579ED5C|nr:hypothetical protein [Mesorhizobium sp.]
MRPYRSRHAAWDILGFAPPLVTTKAEAEEIVGIAERAVRFVMDELVRDGEKV